MLFTRPLATAALSAALVVPLSSQATGDAAERTPPPRLVVLVSVDQLTATGLQRAWRHLGPGGLKRLAREGVQFTRCLYSHAATETGPGHAVLSTGAPARVHGIVRNEWVDAQGRRIYCARPEPKGPLGPELLRAPTLGDAMKAQFGAASKVISISWKDRAALLLGGRSADFAIWVDRNNGRTRARRAADPTKREAPTWADGTAWFRGLTQRAQNQGILEWKRTAPDAAVAGLVDNRKEERASPYGERTFPHVLWEEDVNLPTFYTRLYFSPHANELVARLAASALEHTELGRDAIPDLLAVSFSGTDTVGHAFGPRSVEARDTLLHFDRQLAQLLIRLDGAVGSDHYAVLLSSDHGVAPIPEVVRRETGLEVGRDVLRKVASRVDTELRRQQAEVLPKGKTAPELAKRYVVHARGGALQLRSDLVDRDAAARVAAKVALGVRGVARSYVVRDLLGASEPPTDPIDHAVWNAVYPGRSGDVAIVLAPYWIDEPGLSATHGSPYPYDRHVPMFARGLGLRRGAVHTGEVTPGSVPVLAAHLLGIPGPALATARLPVAALSSDHVSPSRSAPAPKSETPRETDAAPATPAASKKAAPNSAAPDLAAPDLAAPRNAAPAATATRPATIERPALETSARLTKQLEKLRATFKLPALAAAAFDRDRILALGVTGQRASGHDAPVTAADRWHLGSCTKAMTALLVGRLVDRGDLGWDTALVDLLPERYGQMTEQMQKVTVRQLLTHRAGLAANPGPKLMKRLALASGNGRDARRTLLRTLLSAPLAKPPGTEFSYSNTGYMLLGAALEEKLDTDWRTLITREVFEPLRLTSYGFGPPGQADGTAPLQPWGHVGKATVSPTKPLARAVLEIAPDLRLSPKDPTRRTERGDRVNTAADNVIAYGPAGRVHLSLADWTTVLRDVLRGYSGDGVLLQPATYRELLRTTAGDEAQPANRYALGWHVTKRGWAKGPILQHSGSNTMWFASAWLAPDAGVGFVAVTNSAGKTAERATDTAITELILGWRKGTLGSK